MAHHPRLAILHHDDVFNAHAAPLGQVDAGFNCEHHAVTQLVFRCLGHARTLVHLHPDAVAEPVAEVVAVARLLDDIVGQHVRVLAGHALFDQLDRRLLRGEDDVVDLFKRVVGLAKEDRACQVGHVAVKGYAHVDDDAFVLLQLLVARGGVRHRAPGPAADDRIERDRVAAVLADVLLDLPGDLLLGPAGLDPLGDVREGRVADIDGRLDRGNLRGLFDLPQPFDQVQCRDQLRPLRLRQLLDRLPHRAVRLVGDVRPFEGDALAAQSLEDVRQPFVEAADGPQEAAAGRLSLGLVPVSEVGSENGFIWRDQQIRRRAGEAGEVASVDRTGRLRTDDEERVQLVLDELLTYTVDSLLGHRGRLVPEGPTHPAA